MHFTPTSASWMTMVEIFFGMLQHDRCPAGSAVAARRPVRNHDFADPQPTPCLDPLLRDPEDVWLHGQVRVRLDDLCESVPC